MVRSLTPLCHSAYPTFSISNICSLFRSFQVPGVTIIYLFILNTFLFNNILYQTPWKFIKIPNIQCLLHFIVSHWVIFLLSGEGCRLPFHLLSLPVSFPLGLLASFNSGKCSFIVSHTDCFLSPTYSVSGNALMPPPIRQMSLHVYITSCVEYGVPSL